MNTLTGKKHEENNSLKYILEEWGKQEESLKTTVAVCMPTIYHRNYEFQHKRDK